MRFAFLRAGTDLHSVGSAYKMAHSTFLSSSILLFFKFIGKPAVMWKPREYLP